jgi:hypothetical protein
MSAAKALATPSTNAPAVAGAAKRNFFIIVPHLSFLLPDYPKQRLLFHIG